MNCKITELLNVLGADPNDSLERWVQFISIEAEVLSI